MAASTVRDNITSRVERQGGKSLSDVPLQSLSNQSPHAFAIPSREVNILSPIMIRNDPVEVARRMPA